MLKIGLTGGIGSGKSTVAKVFLQLGIPVFFADDESKLLLFQDNVIKKIVSVFGESVLNENKIDKAKLAEIVFVDKEKLKLLNNILHPLVAERYANWIIENKTKSFTIKEAAILFESGSYLDCDKVICVSADENIRIERVVSRDKVSKESVLARINNQWTEEQRIAKSDYVIYNNPNDLIVPQVLKIIESLAHS
ncbi:MAG: dephospho-CoA kinase [Bacteroidota bacterium]